MNKWLLSALCIAMSMSMYAQEILGKWHGISDLNGVKLRIDLNLDTINGQMFATLDSPDQGAYDIPCDAATITGDSLYVSSQVIGWVYTGKLVDGQFVGRMTQVGMNVPLLFKREYIEKVKPKRPQTPMEPFPYGITEVKIQHKEGTHVLAGTLTIPRTQGKVPLAILISGSGPQNRNEEILDHEPFWVIADHLTRQGIAVLRYDDRGTAESTGEFRGATSADFATDVQSIVDWAIGHSKIDYNKIGLIGHSEGGMIAPMVASQDELISFVIMLAGPGTTGREIVLDQTRLVMEASGSSQGEIAAAENEYRELFHLIETIEDPDELTTSITELVTRSVNEMDQTALEAFGGPEKVIAAQISQFNDPWYHYFIKYDPIPAIKTTRCPVLALNGLLDLQVPCSKNLSAIEYALKAGGNPNFEVHAYPELNHLFQHSTTGAPSEYGMIEETFSQEVLNKMSGWIHRVTTK